MDSKLKTAKTTTGQTLVTFETALRRMAKERQHRDGAGTVVHSALLPSWPPLRQAAAPEAFAALLFHLEQRLQLAHTGALLSCMNCESWPSRSRCRVFVAQHKGTLLHTLAFFSCCWCAAVVQRVLCC